MTTALLLLLLLPIPSACKPPPSPSLPIIVHTWGGPFTVAADAAMRRNDDDAAESISALDAVQVGAAACERNQCDGTVGFGGSPDEQCETTLDALIMDGSTMDVGAVAALARVRDAVAVARHVMEHTQHSMLAGESATRFAVDMGFVEEPHLSTNASREACEAWKRADCQPNARIRVLPDASKSCGPYKPLPWTAITTATTTATTTTRSTPGHDTISLVALDARGNMACATSTNGKAHKIPGRVGDAPVAGSGSYVDSQVGGCGATGDGDIMMRFLPCYQAVESMRRGFSPTEAAEDAVKRMARKFPNLQAGLVVMNNKGEHAAAATGWQFSYSYRAADMDHTQVVLVDPISLNEQDQQQQQQQQQGQDDAMSEL